MKINFFKIVIGVKLEIKLELELCLYKNIIGIVIEILWEDKDR